MSSAASGSVPAADVLPMSLPPRNHSCWTKLAAGVQGFTPRQLSLQLFFTRLKHEAMSQTAKEDAIYAFFVKYQVILTQELQQLAALHVL